MQIYAGCVILRKKWALDTKDLQIIAALDKMGGNASAQEIGKYLEDASIEIPTRTIRYRISMLINEHNALRYKYHDLTYIYFCIITNSYIY